MTERQMERLYSEELAELIRRITYDNLPKAHRRIADTVGVEATLKLCEVLGGQGSFYIPGNAFFLRMERDRQIQIEFERGSSVQCIAEKHHLKDADICDILRSACNSEEQDNPCIPPKIQMLVKIIGMENAKKLCSYVGEYGSAFYIPSNAVLKAYLRNLDIHEAYYGKGESVFDIAMEHQITTNRVYEIINSRIEELNPGSDEYKTGRRRKR